MEYPIFHSSPYHALHTQYILESMFLIFLVGLCELIFFLGRNGIYWRAGRNHTVKETKYWIRHRIEWKNGWKVKIRFLYFDVSLFPSFMHCALWWSERFFLAFSTRNYFSYFPPRPCIEIIYFLPQVQLANHNQLGDHYASKHPKEKPPAESGWIFSCTSK